MIYHLLYTVNMGIYSLICYLLDLTIKMASVGVTLYCQVDSVTLNKIT